MQFYACEFTGTIQVPGTGQGLRCHSDLPSVSPAARCSNTSTATGAGANLGWKSGTAELSRFFPPQESFLTP